MFMSSDRVFSTMGRPYLSGVPICCVLGILLITGALGSGHIALKLMEYTHSTPGRLMNGNCCDGVTGSDCSSAVCDPYFIIRIAEKNNRNSVINVQYQTDTLQNVENMIFVDHIGTTLNPVNNSINIWPGTVEVHVDIMDNNSVSGTTSTPTTDGVIANLTALLSRTKDLLLHNETEFAVVDFINDNSTLRAVMNVRCDTHYKYDQFCSKYCQPIDNATRHTGCDSDGRVNCLPGWSGDPKTGCLTGVCSPNPCENGGTCTIIQGIASCACRPGVSGRLCENTPTTPSKTTPAKPQSSTSATGSGINSGSNSNIVSQGPSTSSGNHGHGSGTGITSPNAGNHGHGSGTGTSSPNAGNHGHGSGTGTSSPNAGNHGHSSGTGITSPNAGNHGQGSVTGSTGANGIGSGVTGRTTGTGSSGGGSGNAGGVSPTGNSVSSGNGGLHQGHGGHGQSAGTQSDDNGGNNLGAIVGGVVGGLAALALLSLLLFCLIRRRKEKEKVKPVEENPEENGAQEATTDDTPLPAADNSAVPPASHDLR